jgi:uncharacterized protein YigE (DUF2233 family)
MILAIAALVGLCTTRDVGGVQVSVCEFSIGRDDVELYWRDASGRPIGSFARLDSIVRSHGRHLAFATNGRIFAVGQVPLGLYLDGAISQFYVAPERPDTDGQFAGIIAVTVR